VLELGPGGPGRLAYASRHPDTSVIVTADHECGGLAVAGSLDQPYPYEPGGGLLDTLLAGEDGPFPVADSDYGFVLGWATTGHTSAPVPITAIGPGTENLAGVIENTDLFHAMAHALSLTGSPANKRRG
jgi:alkaline phosphatase